MAEVVTLEGTQRATVLGFIDDAIPKAEGERTDIARIPDEYAQKALDVVWQLLDPSNLPSPDLAAQLRRPLTKQALRKVAVQLTVKHNSLPSSFYLKNVRSLGNEAVGSGFLADLYRGEWNGVIVGLKRLRINQSNQDEAQKLQLAFCRESLFWKGLNYKHILPMHGVSDDAFQSAIAIVLPWMEHGNVKQYTASLRERSEVTESSLVTLINKWLYQTLLGVAYLHQEGIVHGDLHGGNILIDTNGDVCLTDFGMGVIVEATPNMYGSNHAGGGHQFKSPERHDPEEFDMDDTRPTPMSDVYAFACVCVELYTERAPFASTTTRNVAREVMKGVRPLRPKTRDDIAMADDIWELVQRCWAHKPTDRPTSIDAANELATILKLPAPDLPTPTLIAVKSSPPSSRQPPAEPERVPDPKLTSQPEPEAARTKDMTSPVVEKDSNLLSVPQSHPAIPGTAPAAKEHATATASNYEALPPEVLQSKAKKTFIPSPTGRTPASTPAPSHTETHQSQSQPPGNPPARSNGHSQANGSKKLRVDDEEVPRGCFSWLCCR